MMADKLIKELMDNKVVNLGVVTTRNLPGTSDSQCDIYSDEVEEQLEIASEPVSFDYDDINENSNYF